MTDPSHTFTASNGRSITLEVRAHDGVGAGLPFAIITDDGRVELSQRQLEFICAVAGRAQSLARERSTDV